MARETNNSACYLHDNSEKERQNSKWKPLKPCPILPSELFFFAWVYVEKLLFRGNVCLGRKWNTESMKRKTSQESLQHNVFVEQLSTLLRILNGNKYFSQCPTNALKFYVSSSAFNFVKYHENKGATFKSVMTPGIFTLLNNRLYEESCTLRDRWHLFCLLVRALLPW